MVAEGTSATLYGGGWAIDRLHGPGRLAAGRALGAGAAAGGSAGVLEARGDAADREEEQALVRAGLLGDLIRAQRGQRAQLEV
jgi:hypothetical protein